MPLHRQLTNGGLRLKPRITEFRCVDRPGRLSFSGAGERGRSSTRRRSGGYGRGGSLGRGGSSGRSISRWSGERRSRHGLGRRPRGTTAASRSRRSPGRCWPGSGCVPCVCRRVWADRLDGFAAGAPPQHGVQHVVGDDQRSSAVTPFAGGGVEPLVFVVPAPATPPQVQHPVCPISELFR